LTPPSPPPLLLLPPPPPLVSPYFTLYKYSHRLALSNVRRLNTKLAEKKKFFLFLLLAKHGWQAGNEVDWEWSLLFLLLYHQYHQRCHEWRNRGKDGVRRGLRQMPKVRTCTCCCQRRKEREKKKGGPSWLEGLNLTRSSSSSSSSSRWGFFCEEPPKKRCGYCHGVTLRGISIYPHILGIICLGDGAGVQR